MFLIEVRFDNGIRYSFGYGRTTNKAIAVAERNALLGRLSLKKATKWRKRNPQDSGCNDRVRRFRAHDGKAGHIAIYQGE